MKYSDTFQIDLYVVHDFVWVILFRKCQVIIRNRKEIWIMIILYVESVHMIDH